MYLLLVCDGIHVWRYEYPLQEAATAARELRELGWHVDVFSEVVES